MSGQHVSCMFASKGAFILYIFEYRSRRGKKRFFLTCLFMFHCHSVIKEREIPRFEIKTSFVSDIYVLHNTRESS